MSGDTTLVVGLLRESPLSGSSEPQPGMAANGRIALLAVANQAPSPDPRIIVEEDDDEEDEDGRAEKEKEKEKKELLKMQAEATIMTQSPSPPTTAAPPSASSMNCFAFTIYNALPGSC